MAAHGSCLTPQRARAIPRPCLIAVRPLPLWSDHPSGVARLAATPGLGGARRSIVSPPVVGSSTALH
jgi:hypothetical protein